MNPNELYEKLKAIGASELDANLIVSCLVNRTSYSWSNNDPIDERTVERINAFLKENSIPLIVKMERVSTRSLYLWEVKNLNPRPDPEPEPFKSLPFV
ncbi:MAG: hypothetical protein QXP42_03630 [Candidatus Micrarchaeia archaeon]